MRYLYSENEPIEKHPPRQTGEPIVIINKRTGMPEIGYFVEGWFYMVRDKSRDKVILRKDGHNYKLSPHYWEIAWP